MSKSAYVISAIVIIGAISGVIAAFQTPQIA